MIHNLKEYKEAKAILPHLDSILKVFDLTERSLKYFNMFIPVAKVLQVIKNEKSVLESYKVKYQKIKSTKASK